MGEQGLSCVGVGPEQQLRRRGPGSASALKAANRRRLLRAVQFAGEITQAGLARATGLAAGTVSNLVRELEQAGLVSVSPVIHGGRRARAVRLAAPGGLVAGVDFGHRHLSVAVADLSCQVLAHARVGLPDRHRADEGLEQAATLLDTALGQAGAQRAALLGIGLGLPAPIDSRTGRVGAPTILPGWVGADAATLAGERFGAEVFVDNDANLGALAEVTWGAGRGAASSAYLKLSDGVGAGLILNGQLYRGRIGTAGEIGHTTMQEYGTVCRCGNRGCLETLVSSEAVLDLLHPTHGARLTIARVVELARGGDAGCLRVLADTGRHVGIAVANLCNLVNPDRIIVGGELAAAGELLLDPLRLTLTRYGIPSAVADLDLVVGTLGERAHLLGAVALAAGQVPIARPTAIDFTLEV
jgi:predicted NBD/HSP70 family sugar kinase